MNKRRISITEKSRNVWLKWILDIKERFISDKYISYVVLIYRVIILSDHLFKYHNA